MKSAASLLVALLSLALASPTPVGAARPAVDQKAPQKPMKAAPTETDDDPEYDPYICGPLKNAFGPFDFRIVSEPNRTVVETFHYEPGMQGLRRGQWRNERGFIWGEFDYTLRAMPNHPGSLAAVDQMALAFKSDKPPGAQKSALCYFLRAMAFTPDDATVRLLYGLYLLRRDRFESAIRQMQMAEELKPDDRSVQYNLGLAYFRLKDYDRALKHAHKAYEMGFPLGGLRTMLQKAGKWRDLPPLPASPADEN
jgi:hypothetical protein